MRTPKCAICRCEIDQKNLISNRYVRNAIELLQVKCPLNCQWIGAVHNLEHHLKIDCLMALIACSNKGCNLRIIKHTIHYHTTSVCSFRKVKCTYCLKTVIQNKLDHHHNVKCQEILVSCTNSCDELQQCFIKRKELENHKKTTCTLQPLECPFFSIGCGVDCNGLVCRNVFSAHVNNAFTSLNKSVVKLVVNNVELNNKNLKLRKKNILITKRINKFNKKNDELYTKNQKKFANTNSINNLNNFTQYIFNKQEHVDFVLSILNKMQYFNDCVVQFELKKCIQKCIAENNFAELEKLYNSFVVLEIETFFLN
jgi:hypothetical protein